MKLYFAPLQGYTDRVYRAAHQWLIGGITSYYTPFLRWDHGEVRNKDLRDVQCDEAFLKGLHLPEQPDCLSPKEGSFTNPQGSDFIAKRSCQSSYVSTACCSTSAATTTTAGTFRPAWVPQIIAKDSDEMAHLCDVLQKLGFEHIDINLGCPFPMQVHQGRGCGLLPYPDKVESLLREAEKRADCHFSVKMRLGWETAAESLNLLPLLNDSCLCLITLHPRLGQQQYKGEVDRNAFQKFYNLCRKPLIYNGDIRTSAQAETVMNDFPLLAGLMIGRGLLAQPTLALEITQGRTFSGQERVAATFALHDAVHAYAVNHLQGDSQILAHLRAFWEYQEANLPKKTFKRLCKCGNLKNYEEALHQWHEEAQQ